VARRKDRDHIFAALLSSDWFVTGVQVARGEWEWPLRAEGDPNLSELIQRALGEIDPAPNHAKECKNKISEIIVLEPTEMYNAVVQTWLATANKGERRELRKIARALRKAVTTLTCFSPQWQEILFVVQSRRVLGAVIGEEGITWPDARERAEVFSALLTKVAERAEQYASLDMGFFLGERRADAQKRYAANCAFDLMVKFGRKPPTLTPDGPYYTLASILYESFTGLDNENLERQCRSMHKGAQGKSLADASGREPPDALVRKAELYLKSHHSGRKRT
jgi:hypothetical protein